MMIKGRVASMLLMSEVEQESGIEYFCSQAQLTSAAGVLASLCQDQRKVL